MSIADAISYQKTLTLCRRIYRKCSSPDMRLLRHEEDPDVAGEYIYNLLASNKPCMIARFGANELNTLFNYLGITEHRGDALGYITCKNGPWWWNKQILWQMELCAGFFPVDDQNLAHFCELMLADIPQLDVLGCWLHEEICVESLLKGTYKVAFPWLNPWFQKKPWTRALVNKKVLVVHPFDKLIQQQYEKRELLFKNDGLPTFKELHTLKAIMSLGNNSSTCGYKTWFDALQQMENEMDKIDYDVCILGCGAYGFPLAAHAKRMGKQAVHLGGMTQILFGITGKGFLNPNRTDYKRWPIPRNYYIDIVNEHWVRPGDEYKPKDVEHAENGAYW